MYSLSLEETMQYNTHTHAHTQARTHARTLLYVYCITGVPFFTLCGGILQLKKIQWLKMSAMVSEAVFKKHLRAFLVNKEKEIVVMVSIRY